MSKTIDAFLSKSNIDKLRVGIPKEYFVKLLPKFVDFMVAELKTSINTSSVPQNVTKYNRKFKQIAHNEIMNDMVDTRVSMGKLTHGDYAKSSPDAMLNQWSTSVARQIQCREDRQQYVPDFDDTEADYDVVREKSDIVDMYTSENITSHVDPEDIFKSPTMQAMNVDGYGYSMTYDDHDSALALQEQIFGSSDIDAVNGYLGVRADMNIKERKNHVREYDRGNDGVRGTELDGMPLRRDMKNLRKRY